MKLHQAASETLQALRRADGAPFTELVKIAGLDPARDLRDTDLSGVDFAGSDLAGYDFSGARLSNASFVGARNYDHARFERAELDGVTWPADWQPGKSGSLRRALPRLNSRQQEIVEVLLDALRSRSPARAVAMMPPGTGKSAILSEVFRKLTRTKAFRRGLILCDTIVERNQLIQLLNVRAIVTADVNKARNRGVIPLREILVETFGNYSRMQRELNLEPSWDGNPLKCTHVAMMSLPSRRRSAIRMMAAAESPPAMLAFIEALAGNASGEERLTRSSLGGIFESITYRYGIDQAVADGFLVLSELFDRSHAIPVAGKRRTVLQERASAVMEEVASDFAMEIDRASEPPRALLIVPNNANTKLLADEMDLQLRRASEGFGKAPEVLVLSLREPRSDRSPTARPGAVAISTPAVADGLDLREFRLVGVLSGLGDRLSTKLMFTPSTRVNTDRIRVIDYVGGLAEIAKGFPKDY